MNNQNNRSIEVSMKKGLCLVLVSIMALCLLGCRNLNTVYENGFFQYKILYADPKTEHIMIIGLTESGKEQTTLVIPESIDGIPVLKLGKDARLMLGADEGQFISDRLEKVYIGPTLQRCRADFFSGCPNLKTVLVNNAFVVPQIDIDNYDPTIPCQLRLYIPITQARLDVTYIEFDDMMTFANITYYWNYPDSPNEGVYFIDDADGLIDDFLPPTPVREGFVFAGWFKDAEGTDNWDFANDSVMGRVFDEQGLWPYQETAMYAKWESI